ncbi:patatin-like phospholipase family protein [Luteococcus peritonei]|uniref:Patatin-like phospholipase family protein n=1 Tax=Luteococcus peritonei TaxID=88874 RepID=A0ABW4RZI8_9ACTN
MARRGWLGIPGVTSLLQNREQREGLVLSGGGSKASFQIGALRYLYERAGIAPTVMVGTSAGSILTALLAQSADPAAQAASVRELERLWLGMERQSDMFTEREWFRRFRSRGPELMALVQRDHSSSRLGWRSQANLPRIQLPFTKGFTIDPEDAPQQRSQHEEPHDEQEGEPLSPQLETLALATRDPEVEPAELSPTTVMAVLAGLSRMRGVGQDLGLILSGAEKTRSMYIPGPILRELLGSGIFDSTKVAASGVTVRIALTALESGELRFMREDGTIVDRDDVPIGGNRHDFSRGVLASCSIPAVFVPVPLDDETYVDGGVRENLPAEMAVGHLGSSPTWVVTSNAPGTGVHESYARKDMISVMMRATEIMSDETERDEVAYARSAGATVIEPEMDVHDSLTIDPGLIRINMDYGWMRAAEAHLGLGAAEQALTREVVELRREAWQLEKDLLDPQVPHNERDLLRLARVKFELHERVPHLRPEVAPEGCAGWWMRWEAHQPPAEVEPPWLV